MKIKNYSEKTVFIAGGSEGIGLSLAKEFSNRGAHVVIFSRSENKLKKALTELEKAKQKPEQKMGSFALDVSVEKDVKKVLESAVKQFGIPDVFINNAGRALPNYFEKISSSQLDETMRINFNSVWYTLSTILPQMKVRGGYVVNVSSMSGYMGVFGYADYTASKFAIIGLSEVLRSEYRKYNITFSVLCPPDTNTPGYKEENKHKPPETAAVTAGAKCLSPDAVAKGCLKGMKKGKFIINPSGMAKMGYFLKRHWPTLLTAMFDGDVKKAQKKMERKK
jgi:short-subunit dehydrogenase